MPSSTATRWLHEALHEGGCFVIRPDGQTMSCSAELLANSTDAQRVRTRFQEKYGSTVYDHYFGPRSKVVRLIPGGTVTPGTPAQLLEQEFDAVAAGYLEAVRSNSIELYVKEATRDRLLDAFRTDGRLLEIGAGTGFETVPLLAAGHPVVVVDLSPRMLEGLAARAAVAGLEERLTCRPGRLSALGEALQEFPDRSFDGAYSTFGAFNLEEDLGSAPATFARVLRPQAHLVFTTLNRPGGAPHPVGGGDREPDRRVPAGPSRDARRNRPIPPHGLPPESLVVGSGPRTALSTRRHPARIGRRTALRVSPARSVDGALRWTESPPVG